jgi:hypothetical protein
MSAIALSKIKHFIGINMKINSKIATAILGLPVILVSSFATISTAQPNTLGNKVLAQSIGANSSNKSPFTKVAVRAISTPGQNQRFSDNFNLKREKRFQVKVFQNGKLNNNIGFNLKKDLRGSGLDPTVLAGVKTGSYVYQGPNSPLYIANPQGAGQAPFIVKFFR